MKSWNTKDQPVAGMKDVGELYPQEAPLQVGVSGPAVQNHEEKLVVY